jgi:hypothetical protein
MMPMVTNMANVPLSLSLADGSKVTLLPNVEQSVDDSLFVQWLNANGGPFSPFGQLLKWTGKPVFSSTQMSQIVSGS